MTAAQGGGEADPPQPAPESALASPARDRVVFVLSALALLALWLLARPYAGIIHDARLYVGRALADLDPNGLGRDLLFAHDGQSGFTLYRPLIRSGVITFGAAPAALSATLVNLCLWFAAAGFFLSRFVQGRRLAAVLAAVAILDPSYGGFDVFRYGEAFASPRPLAEAAVMLSLGLLAMGRLWWALAPLLVAAALHPVMAAPGVLIAFFVHVRRDRRLWWIPVIGGTVALIAAGLRLPLAERLLQTVDPAWAKVLDARTPYLFAGAWRAGDWGRVIVQCAVVAFAAAGTTRHLRTLLQSVLAAAVVGLLATLVLCDALRDVLALQLQPWRALWPLAVAANAAVPLVLLALWRRDARGRTAAALLVLAWLLCEHESWGAIAATLSVIAAAVVMNRPPWRAVLLMRLACAAAAVAAGAELALAAGEAGLLLGAGPPPGGHVSLIALWASGGPTALLVALLGGFAWWFRTRRIGRNTVAAALVVVLLPTLLLWDDRSATERRIEGGRIDPALAQALGPDDGRGVLWVGGDAQPWFLARRANWATSVQGASVVFSRDLALTWDDRIQRLIALGLATEAERRPFTATRRVARANALGASLSICAAADHPAAIMIAGRRPIAVARYWSPEPPEIRVVRKSEGLVYRAVRDYTVVRCDDLNRWSAARPIALSAAKR